MRAWIVSLLALTLAACATVQKLDAAGDVHALLIAIRDNDGATFDRLVDRRALMHEVSGRLAAQATKDPRIPAALAAVLAPGLARIAGDSLIQPEVFRSVADYYGYTPQTRIPGRIAISQSLREMPDGRVCATGKQDGPCLLVFAKGQDGHWRLSGFDGDLSMLRLPH